MSKTPLLDDLRTMIAISPVTHMRAPLGYVRELVQELQDRNDNEETLEIGDTYQVSFPGDPRHILTMEIF